MTNRPLLFVSFIISSAFVHHNGYLYGRRNRGILASTSSSIGTGSTYT
jgi:hypothetical protein